MKEAIAVALIVATAFILTDTAKAQDSCSPNGIDICTMARQMADETAATLPMRINKNLSVQTVFAEHRTVTLTAKFEYNRDFLEQTLAGAGISNDQMLKIMRENARSAMCALDSPTKLFVESGGVIGYLYKFNDGSMYTSVRVDSCT